MTNTEELNTILCEECEAEFTVLHGELDSPNFCPFCSAEIISLEDELEDLDWDDFEE